jgi:hypothetical protein
MLREADVLTLISSEKKAAKSSHSIISGEFCQLSYKKVFLFCYIISLKTILRSILYNIWHIFTYFTGMPLMEYR